jgi:hypothetical protein
MKSILERISNLSPHCANATDVRTMSHEDILDDMSLSDDELLDSLADDMLLEMENEQHQVEEEEVIETINPVRSRPPASAAPAMPMGFPFAGGGGGGGMPDLSQMMSQMMPMMSQMFGGAGGGDPGGAALQQQKLSWEEIVKQHVPHNEQDEWLATIRKDDKTQRENVAANVYGKPPSRAYHGKNAKPLPNVYMESDTLLASLLNEAVRAKKAEHTARWSEYHDNIVSQLAQSGLARVFARDLKQLLRRRVEADPDYAAARAEDPTRFRNIAAALAI